MYEQIFHLNSRPFTATPYVKHYFPGEAIQTSLDQTVLCVDRGSGPVVVVGAAGTGKTLLLAVLESHYQSHYQVVNLGCAKLDERRDLLQHILHDLQLPFQGLSEAELRFSLIDFLKPSESCPNGILLLVDEAHALSSDLLEEIRLITNFVRDGQPQVRLVMAGNQRLEDNLAESKLDSFNQRIAARCYLGNMSRDETADYVMKHIERAGGDGDTLFSQQSLHNIHEVTDGCPRLINQVCDHALILAATRAEQVISGDCIHEAWADVQSLPGSFRPGPRSKPSQALANDEDWTVIEFGSLDENESTDAQPEATQDLGSEPIAPSVADQPEQMQLDASDDLAGDFENPSPAIPTDLHHEPAEQAANDQEYSAHDFQASSSQPIDADDSMLTGEDMKHAQIDDLQLEQDQILEQVAADRAAIYGQEPQLTHDFHAQATDLAPDNQESNPLNPPMDAEYESTSAVNDSEFQIDMKPADEASGIPEVFDHDAPELGADDHSNTTPLSVEVINANAHAENEIDDEQTPDTPSNETIDPFAESFAEEENLIDRYAPFVAHQNQSSLSVTSEELATLTPLDEPETTYCETESCSQFDSSQETPGADAPMDIEAQSTESAVDQQFGPSDASVEYQTPEIESIMDPAMEQHAVAPNAEVEGAESEPEFESVVDATQDFHLHQDDAHSQEIRKQAEEILQRLNVTPDVSCETDSAISQDTADTDAATQESHESATDHTVTSPISLEPTDHALNQDEASGGDFAAQSAALDESQQILNEILEQRNALAQQREQYESTISAHEPTPSEHPADAPTFVKDDQEMIVVERSDESMDSDSQDDGTSLPFPQTPVSTGRAERMDYQKLFEQLRDISNSRP